MPSGQWALIREAGKNWLVPLTKLGILGFSAGGNLAVMTATSFNQRTYESIDPADDLSCRPDFAMPIYPAYLWIREFEEIGPTYPNNEGLPTLFSGAYRG